MSDHPYRNAPDTAFWERSVVREFTPAAVPKRPDTPFGPTDRFMSAGSCFASNVRRYLEAGGFDYTVTEGPHPMWPESAEAPYYEAFSARYGNIYTVRQMVQLIQRAQGTFRPVEEFWVDGETLIDPFRPGLLHRARSVDEFRALTAQHLRAVLRAITESTVFVFTLGLTEAWVSSADGAVFPACPGTVAGTFDPARHAFVNFDANEVRTDLVKMVDLMRSINPSLRIVLTVSPVPLVATATDQHVLTATTYSKAVLRVAAEEAVRLRPDVHYFPAFELVTASQDPGGAFEADLRSVREPVVASVMDAFFTSLCAGGISRPSGPGDSGRTSATADAARLRLIATSAIEAECEEMMMDELRPRQKPETRRAGSFDERVGDLDL